jgi:hypothetical protein
MDLANNNKSHLVLISDRARNADPGMDFLEASKKAVQSKIYFTDPIAMPAKEVKPLKFSKIDIFASDVRRRADRIPSAQESGSHDKDAAEIIYGRQARRKRKDQRISRRYAAERLRRQNTGQPLYRGVLSDIRGSFAGGPA